MFGAAVGTVSHLWPTVWTTSFTRLYICSYSGDEAAPRKEKLHSTCRRAECRYFRSIFRGSVREKKILYTVLSASFEHPSQAFKNNYSLDGNSRDWAEFGWVSGRRLQALKSEQFEIRTITFQRLHPGWNVKICSDFWLTVTLGAFLCFSKIDRTLRLRPGPNDVPRNSTNTKFSDGNSTSWRVKHIIFWI